MSSHRERGRPPYGDVLTPAEWRVVEAVRHGMSNPAIAARQGVSADAVKYHVANALQKLGFANRRELRHWDGVRRDSPLFQQESPMRQAVQLGPIHQIARTVSDIDAAVAWYRDVLGLRHLYTFGNACLLRLRWCSPVSVARRRSSGRSRSFTSGLPISARRIEALAARGVDFLSAPHMIHRHADGAEEWLAAFQDNEARPLAIMAVAGG